MNKSYPVPERDPPLSPRVTLPTMYDLPSEDPLEPGLRSEYHLLQPQLLSRTFSTPCYQCDRIFTGSDINLYYDVRHPLWYKRPDWFVVVGVPRLYDEVELRSSYVTWQEGVNRLWLRWYDEQENWILTDTEQERQRAEQAELKLRQIVQNLLQTGMTIEQVIQLTQLSEEQVQNLA